MNPRLILPTTALLLLSACGTSTPSRNASLHNPIPSQELKTAITPGSKGSTLGNGIDGSIDNKNSLSITPRTKGTTYLQGRIVLPATLNTQRFEITLRQEDLRLTPQSIETLSQDTFEIQALSVTGGMPLYLEARSMEHPEIVLMREIMIPEEIPAELRLQLSIDSTAAVYTSRYLNLNASRDDLMKMPEVLTPVNTMLTDHFMAIQNEELSSQEKMMDMPQMTESLEKARIIWTELKQQDHAS